MDQFQEVLQKIILVVGNGLTLASVPALAGRVFANNVQVLGAGALTTQMIIPHGLGFAPNITAVRGLWVGLDDNVTGAAITITKADATNIVCKATAAVAANATAFLLVVLLDTDIGGRYSNP